MTSFEGHIDVVGGRLWMEADGEGSGVVLVHAGIADSRMWEPQWDALVAAHRAVRYDTRGFGRTEGEDVAFSNRADLIAAMDTAGIERATLVGCSRAGAIVLDTALEFPDRVAGLVWVCGGVGGLEMEDTPEEIEMYERGEALEEAKDWDAAADHDVALWVDGVGQPAGRAPQAVRELVRTMTYETYVQDKVYGQPIQLDPPAAGRLGEIRVPTLVIIGELDTLGTRLSAEVLASSLQDAHRITVPNVAHLPSLERPEWFTRTLLDFLARVEDPEPEFAS